MQTSPPSLLLLLPPSPAAGDWVPVQDDGRIYGPCSDLSGNAFSIVGDATTRQGSSMTTAAAVSPG